MNFLYESARKRRKFVDFVLGFEKLQFSNQQGLRRLKHSMIEMPIASQLRSDPMVHGHLLWSTFPNIAPVRTGAKNKV